MSDIVYATRTCFVAHDGKRVRVQAGQAWRADDPLVKAKPDLFGVEPEQVAATRPVERATRAPGERRPVKRNGKTAR